MEKQKAHEGSHTVQQTFKSDHQFARTLEASDDLKLRSVDPLAPVNAKKNS